MINYVIINGVNSNTKNGLMINELPPISKPQMRTDIEEIDGRDGDIITKLGYSAYDKTITIGLWGTSYDVNDIIAFFNKEGIITFSNEPDKYYKFTMLDDFDIETLLRFKTASITFHCQPYKYPTEETPIEIEYEYIEQDNVESATLNNTNGDSHLDITLKGNTSQYTTTGKNLLCFVDKSSTTYKDVTYTISNGEITLNGTASGSGRIEIPLLFSITLTSGTNYTLSGNFSGTIANKNIEIQIRNSSDNIVNPTQQQLATPITYNNISGTAVMLGIYLVSGGTFTNYKIKPQLEIGASATSWEIGTNGASPNPSYPQPINVVSGDNTIEVVGKNLFDYDTYISNSTFKFSVIGGATLYRNGNIGNLTKWKIYDENNNYISDMSPFPSTGTFTIPNNAKYIEVNDDTGLTSELYIGYSSNTTYEPYQSQTYPINLPVENLINRTTCAENKTLIWTNGDEYSGTGSISTDYISARANDVFTTNYKQNVFAYDSSKNYIGNLSSEGTLSQVSHSEISFTTFTLPNDNTIAYIRLSFRSGVNTGVDLLNANLQCEKGDKANHYTPYGTTPMELCKIGDYQDYFTKNSDGQWCKYNAIGKVVLDGSETWNNDGGGAPFRLTLDDANVFKSVDLPPLCYVDKFLGVSYNANWNNYNSMVSTTTYTEANRAKYLKFRYINISSLVDFKTWLSTHNTTLYYVLSTPYLSLIEDTTLINQLDNLEYAMSYEGQTNVSQVNNDKAFIMDLIAIKDGTDEVEVNNIGNTYSKPTIALEGTGDINIYLNGTQMLKATLTDKMTIDTTNLEAYNPDTMTLLNRQLVGDISKFTLSSGNNTIKVDGNLTKATITDYVRYL